MRVNLDDVILDPGIWDAWQLHAAEQVQQNLGPAGNPYGIVCPDGILLIAVDWGIPAIATVTMTVAAGKWRHKRRN